MDISEYYDENGVLDTDELAFLAEKNHAVFAAVRLAILDDAINSTPLEQRGGLRAFQDELDKVLSKKEPGEERIKFLTKKLADSTKKLADLYQEVKTDMEKLKE